MVLGSHIWFERRPSHSRVSKSAQVNHKHLRRFDASLNTDCVYSRGRTVSELKLSISVVIVKSWQLVKPTIVKVSLTQMNIGRRENLDLTMFSICTQYVVRLFSEGKIKERTIIRNLRTRFLSTCAEASRNCSCTCTATTIKNNDVAIQQEVPNELHSAESI